MATRVAARVERHKERWMRTAQAVCVVWGFVLLSAHLHAILVPRDGTGLKCYMHTTPWFTQQYACTVLELNCVRDGHPGDVANFTASLDRVDRWSLGFLIFADCPAFHMPPKIQALPNLFGLEIYNATLVAWGDDAAVRNTYHPHLAITYVVRVNLTGIPRGLMHADFPQRLSDMEFCIANLTTLPDQVLAVWPAQIMFLYLEDGHFTEIPEVVKTLKFFHLSFVGNKIETIPDDMFANKQFQTLELSDNPLAHLPASLGDLSAIWRIRLEYTAIETLDLNASATSLKGVTVLGGGSPFCDAGDGDGAYDRSIKVDCSPRVRSALPAFPWEQKDEDRAL